MAWREEPLPATGAPVRPCWTVEAGNRAAALHGGRTLVQEHGGRVEIASKPGLGTTLTVVLACH
ncbi:MAG: hypothetical protein JWQ13_411 [Ramlibacter sp.]|jgi:hypothetical protein|nr:hypothetical protein [Ramlibacter sp.]